MMNTINIHMTCRFHRVLNTVIRIATKRSDIPIIISLMCIINTITKSL